MLDEAKSPSVFMFMLDSQRQIYVVSFILYLMKYDDIFRNISEIECALFQGPEYFFGPIYFLD